MKPRSRSGAFFTLLLCAILFFSVAPWLAARVISTAEEQAVDSLRLTIARDAVPPLAGKPPNFKVELRNTGKDDLILNLGVMLANGRKQYPRAISLLVTDSEGKYRVFDLREPGIVAGRLDPMILPLPIRATFTLHVDLANYWSAATREFDYKFKGSYSIEAKLTGEKVSREMDTLLAPYWVGQVISNRLAFEVSN